jgi:hypothetical protein
LSVFRIGSCGLGGFDVDDRAEIGLRILGAVTEMVVPGGLVPTVAVAAAGDFGGRKNESPMTGGRSPMLMKIGENEGVVKRSVGVGTGVKLVNETDRIRVQESPIGALGPCKKIFA